MSAAATSIAQAAKEGRTFPVWPVPSGWRQLPTEKVWTVFFWMFIIVLFGVLLECIDCLHDSIGR